MLTQRVTEQSADAHFSMRAHKYNESSRWCTDTALLNKAFDLVKPDSKDRVLDVAVGTGKVSQFLKSRVADIEGVDINAEMVKQALPFLDKLVMAPAETLPFEDNTYDLAVCRQGIQFMDAPAALREVYRVLKPHGRILLIDLCAYDEKDRDEYFEILKLRNPARRNFFVYGDVADLLTEVGFTGVKTERYMSSEDVDFWSDNSAISEKRREDIRAVYRDASPDFARRHSVMIVDGRITDQMLFSLTAGWKEGPA